MKYVEVCNIGKVRVINQDSVFSASRENVGLFVVADGMGGHSHGELASQYIIEALCKWWYAFCAEDYQYDFKRMMQALYQEMERINQDIFHLYNGDAICGSTVILLFIYQNMYGILQAGDSRIYAYCRRDFLLLTVDEIWESQSGLTLEEKKRSWSQCHGKLLNAIGIRDNVRCRMRSGMVKKDMVFLLCSDGLYKYCPEQAIKKCMKKSRKEDKLEAACNTLLSMVLKGEAKDNVSIVLVHV